ncbi:C4-dicarboxylate ABC transporter [Allofranklinella schreckenbergeri]|uniref:C4-dicarboxylate ABC transporter n=1 Tax=Allofranklinella schreckenbergeri TaxID=1076744 RepID=A0A3M6PVI6_9BURK|nr:TRAP transporter substrate-binding protein [Allofranklinella schreckenbergeri]RMW95107.1 C4-dicarboxylate ABC transporter [Allofranklinella schreckenbergeri]RMW97019.1 C4-dicarboxylate ABC transporter [Allofranklinella schreckenbergeri]RRD41434.1 TRAP transporter substrate-binding protein [Comamonadaceae bacterium OH3737_COT-264]
MRLNRKQFLGALSAATLAIAALTSGAAHAQERYTLRLHHFLPPQAPIPKDGLAKWAEKIQKDSDGRLRIQLFPAMQLGGKPTDLFDQARNGVVDFSWTVLGYTPGRFPKTEVFELPFSIGSAAQASPAIYEYVQNHAADEFKDVKLITVHTHGPGLFHTRKPIAKLEDLRGMKIRGGSRIINIMLEQLGAVPVGMPVPQVSEAISKGVLDGTTVPWEVVPALRVQQIVKNHTGFSGPKGLYTQTFGLLMNQASYDKLPDDLKRVIDANSGIEVARAFGLVMDAADQTGIDLAQKARNHIVTLDEAETQRWKDAAQATRQSWFKEVQQRGIDGPKLAEEAQRLLDKHSGAAQ